MTRVLLTGASGYIGRRLKRRLLERTDVELRLLVRNASAMDPDTGAEIIEGSTFDDQALQRALDGVDLAYYLIHSMGGGADYRERDLESARRFRDAAIAAGVQRIVYLGGLGEPGQSSSKHLLSRYETGAELGARPDAIETLWFRAGVIIGSGSASFEILRHLVQKLPVLITPRWVRTMAQPIGVRDVLEYLCAAIDLPAGIGTLQVDIGADQMSYGQMMLKAAQVMELKRLLVAVPVLSPRLSSYWLTIFTPVPYGVSAELIEGLRTEVLVRNDHAHQYFPQIEPEPFVQAVRRALENIERNQVQSRWSDSGGDLWQRDPLHGIANAVFTDRRVQDFDCEPHQVFRSFCALGGKQGWFTWDWLWDVRGAIDKLFGGYGTNRGRRHPTQLRTGDSLDFWKVVRIEPDRSLLLFAQMKLPGKAWLEFRIAEGQLIQTAYYLPRGLAGRLYWYAIWPLHALVFPDLARNIVRRAERQERASVEQ